jgi:hypothetical protein
VRTTSLQKGITYARKADKYATWKHEVSKDNFTWLNSNEYTSREGAKLKLPKILFNQLRGPHCFDYQHYLDRNQDLRVRRGLLLCRPAVPPCCAALLGCCPALQLRLHSPRRRAPLPPAQVLGNNWNLWQHFLFTGQFEQRQHRFTCEADYKKMVEMALSNDVTQLVDPRVVQQLMAGQGGTVKAEK